MIKFHSHLLQLAAICMLLVAPACSDSDDAPTLDVSLQSVALAASGEAQTVTVATNQQTWEASLPEADTWCHLSKSNDKLTISADANDQITTRQTTVTVIAGGGNSAKPVLISVTQAAAEPLLSVDPASVELDMTGNTDTEIVVTTNLGEWTATPADDWCTATVEGDRLTLAADIYIGDERTTTVAIDAGSGVSARSTTLTVVQKGGKATYEIEIPTDFSEGFVKKAMQDQTQVAEICREYIRSGSTDEQMTVVYPVVDGKTDLTKGIEVKTGGQIVWDTAANTCTHTPGTAAEPLTKLYIEPDGSIVATTQSPAIVSLTVKTDLLVDTRGTESNVYKIVKIGTQYWMAENLRAECFADGSALSTDWNSQSGAYKYLYNDKTTNKTSLGALYSGYAVVNEAGIAPSGWKVPANAEWTTLKSYLGTAAGKKLKADNTGYWPDKNGSDISGFNALPAQSYNTDFDDAIIETWFWSKTIVNDWLTKADALHYVRLTNRGDTITFTPEMTTHSYNFGHSIRCIRQ